MNEVVNNDKHHHACKSKEGTNTYHLGCEYRSTNLVRVNAIRGLLKRTDQLMRDNGIPYALYYGSALGQARCQDVIPHDNDCDVIVWESDLHKLTNNDLDHQYTVVNTTDVNVAYRVVDKYTGFFCDIWYMQADVER